MEGSLPLPPLILGGSPVLCVPPMPRGDALSGRQVGPIFSMGEVPYQLHGNIFASNGHTQ